MDIEEAKKFSKILDGLLSSDQDIREKTEKEVQILIEKDLILTFCYSIFKTKEEEKNNGKLGVIIACNISREIRKRKDKIGQGKVPILKKIIEDVMLLVTQDASRFVSISSAEIFSNILDTIAWYDKEALHGFFKNIEGLRTKSEMAYLKIISELAKLSYYDETPVEYKAMTCKTCKDILVDTQGYELGRLAALFEFLGNLAEFTEQENLALFSELTFPIVQTLKWLIFTNKNFDEDFQGILENLDVYLDLAGKICVEGVPDLIDLFYVALDTQPFDPGVKIILREVTLNVVYIAPFELVEQKKLMDKVILIMIGALCPEIGIITKRWAEPEAEDKFLPDTIQESLGLLDRFISIFPYDRLLPLLSTQVQKLLQKDRWTYQYAALMSLSQIGEHVNSVEELRPLMHLIQGYLKDSNPMIRNACFHCFAQFCEDKKKAFQKVFSIEIVEWTMEGLTDNIPRVRAYAASALCNFLEGCTPDLIKDFIQNILHFLIRVTKEDSMFVVNTSLPTLSALAIAAKHEISIHFDKILSHLKECFNIYHSKSVTASCRIIECLSLTFLYTEDHVFKEKINDILFILKFFQSQIINLNDARIFYLLSAWERVLIRMKHGASGLVNEIYIVLRKVLEQVFEYKNQKQKAEARKLIAIETIDPSKVYSVCQTDINKSIDLMLLLLKFMNFDNLKQIEHMLKSAVICSIELPYPKINLKGLKATRILLKGLLSNDKTSGRFVSYRENLFFSICGKINTVQNNPEFQANLLQSLVSLLQISNSSFCSSGSLKRCLEYVIKLIERTIMSIKQTRKMMDQTKLALDQADFELLHNKISFNLISLKYCIVILEFLLKTHQEFKNAFEEFFVKNMLLRLYLDKETFEVVVFSRMLLVALIRVYNNGILKYIEIGKLGEMIFE